MTRRDAMSEVTSWKWWVSGFGVPLAAVLVAIGALYLQYLQYTKDINELRAQWRAENEAQVRHFQEIIDKLNRDLAERDRVIKVQKTQLDKLASIPLLTPPPSTPFRFDFDK